jgi:hypothetical protein
MAAPAGTAISGVGIDFLGPLGFHRSLFTYVLRSCCTLMLRLAQGLRTLHERRTSRVVNPLSFSRLLARDGTRSLLLHL